MRSTPLQRSDATRYHTHPRVQGQMEFRKPHAIQVGMINPFHTEREQTTSFDLVAARAGTGILCADPIPDVVKALSPASAM